jgi:hypothetical protein
MAGTLTITTLNASSGVLQTQNGMTGIAKAWVNFSVAGSACTVVSSFNISSVTYNSAGNFTINMTTAMPNANYTAIIGAVNTFGSSVYYGTGNLGTNTASSFSMRMVGGNGSYIDGLNNGYAAVFSS